MQTIPGDYCMAGRSSVRPAIALLRDDGGLRILATDSDTELVSTRLSECHQGDVLPGLPVELFFKDGDYFIPADVSMRWQRHSATGLLAWMESHLATVLLAALLVPLSFWLTFVKLIPAGAESTAFLIPQSALNEIGSSSLKAMDFALQDSELTQSEQNEILHDWEESAKRAGLTGEYHVIFRRGDEPVANAFALADGTIVVFDGLVETLSREQLIAVLFHEAGHVDHRHHAQMIIQASLGAIIYGMLLGDVDGLAESVLGAGLSLGENAFSRKMETEADDFASLKLTAAGMSPSSLSEALGALPDHDDSANSWMEYLSTHPDTDKRVERITGSENPDSE